MFRTHEQVNTVQNCNRIVVIAAAVGGISFGCFFAYRLTLTPSGYVVPYLTISALAAAMLLALMGALFLIFERTRWLGLGLIIAGALTFATYEIGARALLRTDLIPWHPPAIELVAGQPAGVLIRFKRNLTEQQVNDFMSSRLRFMPNWADSLDRPRREADGGWALTLIVSDTAFGGKRASALQSKMLAENVSGFMVAMRHDPRVSSVELQRQH
jgi:hypothetical protein